MSDRRERTERTLQDLVWLLLFGGLALASQDRNPAKLSLLAVLCVFQLAEPRIAYFASQRGIIAANFVRLALGFFIIGYSGGIASSYYLILLIPIVSAATSFGLLGTMLFTFLACGLYLIFIHPFFLDPDRFVLTTEGMRELSLHVIFLPVIGFLTNQLAEANRITVRRYQSTAEQLSEANRNLQEAEDAMRRSERLAALGQMSAGLAHELRNPLGTVRASAEMLSKNLPAESAVAKELAGFISSEVDRANSLVTRFLDFARPLQIRRQVQPLTEPLDRAVAQIERHNPPFAVTLHKNYSPDIRPFAFDSELIERVIYNLLLNAAQASPEGAGITLKTRTADGYAEISVIDRGSGVAPEIRESIFNPFFTTKREGVGLGLAICAKIVGEHGGKITMESEAGIGSVFRVLLPLDLPEPAS